MRKILVLLWLCLIFPKVSKSQNTLVTLADSTKLKTEITTISDELLFTKAGSFNLTEIYSIRFLTNEEYSRKEVFAGILTSYPILVYKVNSLLPRTDRIKRPLEKIDSPGDVSKYIYDADQTPSIGDFGIGAGLDYGGFGGRLTFLANKAFGFFFGGGYALVGFGYNAGINFRTRPDKKATLFVNMMYGYNAAIVIAGAPQYNKVYYGPSAGVGFMFKPRNNNKNYFAIELIIPFRSYQFDSDYNALKNNPNIKIGPIIPVAFSFGYHFGF